ncbi:MAG: hypothetical protein JRI23_33030 [Deltaproteobacteria bacterium]|jgi:hypothetical protein|nr:hypothetical protein [Deltaproteobacteria bacterium]MBW2537078.1 hypothetical protein [Deltaproteobacteria bacterium]
MGYICLAALVATGALGVFSDTMAALGGGRPALDAAADVADDGEVLWDPIWEGLNPPGFRYGHGGRDVRSPTASAWSTTYPDS